MWTTKWVSIADISSTQCYRQQFKRETDLKIANFTNFPKIMKVSCILTYLTFLYLGLLRSKVFVKLDHPVFDRGTVKSKITRGVSGLIVLY